MTALNYFRKTPTIQQLQIFEQTQGLWNDHDVIVVQGPVAVGKTLVAEAFCRYAEAWNVASGLVVPNEQLQSQVERECPDTFASVWGAHSYRCVDFQTTCGARKRNKKNKPCASCPHTRALIEAKGTKPRLYNPRTLLGTRSTLKYPRMLVFDEAHKMIDLMQEGAGVKLWRRDHLWPRECETHSDIVAWIDNCQKNTYSPTLEKAKNLLTRRGAEVVAKYGQELLRGKPEDILRIVPLSPRNEPPVYWPRSVRKLILMSATIGKKDIEDLGLDTRSVGYVTCDSPIAPALRPLIHRPLLDMSFSEKHASLPKLADLVKSVAAQHPQTRGLVHLTYEDARLLRPFLSDSRFMWHDKSNKDLVYNEWRSPRGLGRVLCGSGFTEGVDLKGDACRWQILTKIPYLSLADQVIAARAERDPEWYAWASIKNLIQAYGRVCRSPTDFGTTYVFDVNLRRLYDEYEYLFPMWLKSAIKWN